MVPQGFRDQFLRTVVLLGVAVLAITELLGALHAIRRVPLLVCWAAVLTVATLYTRNRIRPGDFRIPPAVRDPVVLLCAAGSAAILAVTAITAFRSPPNSADAMAYHLPRVVYWAEQASVRFFPTPYLNQIMLQPLTEYFMLHTYVLSGGDHLVNFAQWFGSLVCIIGVSSIAKVFGAGSRGQAIASLFCATLPSGVLAASGAKNDYFMAMWLVAAVYFAARFARSQTPGDGVTAGAALGLALLTKATAYLFAPWLIAAAVLPQVRSFHRSSLRGAGAALACALLLNTPHYARNLELSRSIFGFDSAQGDGVFRWRNQKIGWKQTASNALRNVSDQLGNRSDAWNRRVYDWVVRAHHWIGMDPSDPDTTWPWTVYEAPRNANHEADANSQWHLLVLLLATIVLLGRAWRGGDAQPLLYALALLCGFVAFCAYLKWQLYLARLFLPLLVAGSPVAGAALDRGRTSYPYLRLGLLLLFCLFLLTTARRPALQNWVRPLQGPRSVFRVPRDDQYFADMSQWNIAPTYTRTAALLRDRDCHLVGIDATNLSLEYPLMALIRERQPAIGFVHTGVSNASIRYPQPVEGVPCAVVCLDCAEDAKRLALYSAFPIRTAVGRFVLFQER
jgi:hypothetical protein